MRLVIGFRVSPASAVTDASSRKLTCRSSYQMGGTRNFFSSLSKLYHYYSLYSPRKYVEHFSNGTTVICLYLKNAPNTKAPPIETSIHQVSWPQIPTSF